MSTLMQASNQWATRPSDQRFTSLDAMLERMRYVRDHSRQSIISSRSLLVEPLDDHRGLIMHGLDDNAAPVVPTHWSFGQLSQLAEAPAGYLRTLPAEIAADAPELRPALQARSGGRGHPDLSRRRAGAARGHRPGLRPHLECRPRERPARSCGRRRQRCLARARRVRREGRDHEGEHDAVRQRPRLLHLPRRRGSPDRDAEQARRQSRLAGARLLRLEQRSRQVDTWHRDVPLRLRLLQSHRLGRDGIQADHRAPHGQGAGSLDRRSEAGADRLLELVNRDGARYGEGRSGEEGRRPRRLPVEALQPQAGDCDQGGARGRRGQAHGNPLGRDDGYHRLRPLDPASRRAGRGREDRRGGARSGDGLIYPRRPAESAQGALMNRPECSFGVIRVNGHSSGLISLAGSPKRFQPKGETMVKFNCTKAELKQISVIADRAKRLGLVTKNYSAHTLIMDVDAVKSNGCPIDLDVLLSFDDFNFIHDVTGIARHLDRGDESPTGGQLQNCFLPRCARPPRPAWMSDKGAESLPEGHPWREAAKRSKTVRS